MPEVALTPVVFHFTVTGADTAPDSDRVSVASRPSSTLCEVADQPTAAVPASVIVVAALVVEPRLDAPPPPLTPVSRSPSVSPRSSTVSAVVAIVTVPVASPDAIVSDPDGAA